MMRGQMILSLLVYLNLNWLLVFLLVFLKNQATFCNERKVLRKGKYDCSVENYQKAF